MQKLTLLGGFLLFLQGFAFAQPCSDLFFSEYLEGSSNNKAIEIYNPTSATVDLNHYVIYRYNNGSAVATDSLHPQGMLAPQSVFVAGNPSAVAAITGVSDTLHSIVFFNGDDAMRLVNKVTSDTLDIIGIVGTDPGTNWVVGTGATSEFTLVRQFGIQSGETNWAISAGQWDVYPQNTTSFLGSHSAAVCCVPTSDSQNIVLCFGDSYSVGNNTYTASGTYSDTLIDAGGCDSILTTLLTIEQEIVVSNILMTCFGDPVSVGGNLYDTTGMYRDTLTAVNGCDSIVVTQLTVLPEIMFSNIINTCFGGSVMVGNNVYTSAGMYYDTLTAGNGCDSIVVTQLTVDTLIETTNVVVLCAGEGVMVGNNFYDTTGIYTDTLVAMSGCDSIVLTDLTVYAPIDTSVMVMGIVLMSNSAVGTYQWLDCANGNAPIMGENSQSFAPTMTGDYAVAVTVNGCTDTSDCHTVMVIVGTNNIADQVMDVSLFPNPNEGMVTIRSTQELRNATVRISNIAGQVVGVQTGLSGMLLSLDMRSLPAGVYMVEVVTDTQRSVLKSIRQ